MTSIDTESNIENRLIKIFLCVFFCFINGLEPQGVKQKPCWKSRLLPLFIATRAHSLCAGCALGSADSNIGEGRVPGFTVRLAVQRGGLTCRHRDSSPQCHDRGDGSKRLSAGVALRGVWLCPALCRPTWAWLTNKMGSLRKIHESRSLCNQHSSLGSYSEKCTLKQKIVCWVFVRDREEEDWAEAEVKLPRKLGSLSQRLGALWGWNQRSCPRWVKLASPVYPHLSQSQDLGYPLRTRPCREWISAAENWQLEAVCQLHFPDSLCCLDSQVSHISSGPLFLRRGRLVEETISLLLRIILGLQLILSFSLFH